MSIVIFFTCIYAFLETAISGYFEYKENKFVGVLLYLIAIFCLVVPNLLASALLSQNQFVLNSCLL